MGWNMGMNARFYWLRWRTVGHECTIDRGTWMAPWKKINLNIVHCDGATWQLKWHTHRKTSENTHVRHPSKLRPGYEWGSLCGTVTQLTCEEHGNDRQNLQARTGSGWSTLDPGPPWMTYLRVMMVGGFWVLKLVLATRASTNRRMDQLIPLLPKQHATKNSKMRPTGDVYPAKNIKNPSLYLLPVKVVIFVILLATFGQHKKTTADHMVIKHHLPW